ncbi:MAG: hypothetical protein H7196_04005 [candidate division SR1 bacterium]|nr:hypothetical protein [candidate division SR1 bacterium]
MSVILLIKKLLLVAILIFVVFSVNILFAQLIVKLSSRAYQSQPLDESDMLRMSYLLEERIWGSGDYYKDRLGTMVNSFYKQDIPKGFSADILTYAPFDDKEQFSRIYTINFTKVWYFGILIETKTIICKI